MKRIILTFIFACAIFLPMLAQAESWHFSNAVFMSPNTRSQPYFVYVPKGRRFIAVRLQGRIIGAGESNVLSIYLDGHLVRTLTPQNGNMLDVAFPDLSAGFHRIVLVGSPTTRAPAHQIGVRCPPLYSLPMSVKNLTLHYQPEQLRAPWLANFPDGLFNPSYPAKQPWLGALVLDPLSTASETAALRLTSGLSANSGVRFIVGDDRLANFLIVLRQESQTAKTQARISIREPVATQVDGAHILQPRVPTLTITYDDTAGLQNAINALLNATYRTQLRAPQAEIPETVAEPKWGVLQTPSTLAELGLANITMTDNQKLGLTLTYPPYWQPIGPINGRLLLRSQAGLPADAHLNVWLDNTLAGSIPLAYIGDGSIQRSVDVNGAHAPAEDTVRLQLDAILEQHASCQLPALSKLWIDAKQSVMRLPHLDKSGIMQLLPALVARPLISTDGSTAALDAALAVVQGEKAVTGGLPLPYEMLGNSDQAQTNAPTPVTLHITIDPKALRLFDNSHAPRINPAYVEHAVWLRATRNGGVSMISGRPENLIALASVWPKAIARIPNGATDVLIDTDNGHVLVLNKLPMTAVEPGGHLSNHQFKYGVIIVLGLMLAFVLVLWVFRKWRRKNS